MTHSELFKLHELVGRLKGREFCLESDITTTDILISSMMTKEYKAHFEGQLKVLQRWHGDNARLLEEVERIIREAENDRE